MEKSFEIAPLVREDIDAFTEIRAACLLEIKGHKVDDEFKRKVSVYLEKHIDDGLVISRVVKSGGKIIAAVILCVYDALPMLENETGRLGYIFNVYTVKEYRGKGIASEMLKQLLIDAKNKGVKEVFLNSEEKAVPLYKKLGFETVNREMVLRFN